MTQEEKFEEAKRLYETANVDQRYVLESLFPELRESEDERIREALIKYLDALDDNEIRYGVSFKDMRTWLEKRGKNNMGISEATKQKLEDNLNKALEKETPEFCNKFLDEQSEQKPLGFNIGDEITVNGQICKVVAVEQNSADKQFTPDQARKAVEIAREEMIDWIEDNIGEYCYGNHLGFSAISIENIDLFDQESFIDDLRKAMKDE